MWNAPIGHSRPIAVGRLTEMRPSGDHPSVDVAQAEELLELARTVDANILGADGEAWVVRLDARFDEVPVAVDVLTAAGDGAAALALVGSLGRYAQSSGRVDEVRALLERTLARSDDAPGEAARAPALLALGELAFRQGDEATASEATEAALAAARQGRDERLQARSEMNLARIAFRAGDAPRICEHAERMLALGGDDPGLRAGAVHMLGWAAYVAGDVPGAIDRFEANVENYRDAGHLEGVASELANVGDLALESGDFGRAAGSLAAALELAAARRSRYLLPSLLASVAMLAGSNGRFPECLQLAAAADAQYEASGLVPDPGGGVDDELRARALDAVGEPEAARLALLGRAASLEEAVALARRVCGV